MSSLPRRFRRNLVSSYLNTATIALITVVMTPVLINGLGTEGYGIWALVGTFALYLQLLQFGLGKATSKYVAQFTATNQPERARSAIATSFWLLILPGLATMGVGAGLALAFPGLFEVSASLEDSARILVLLIVINLAISIPGDTFGFTLIGLQRFDLINTTLIAVGIAQAIGWAIVLAAGGGLVALGIVTVAISLVGQLARYLLVRRLVPQISVSRKHVDRSLIRPFAGLAGWLAVMDVALLLLVRVDLLVVGLALGVAPAAVYAVGQKLTLALEQLIQPASRMFFPHSAELAALSDLPGLRQSMISGTRIALGIAGPLCLTLALMAGPLIDAWVGDGFEQAGTVVALLAAALAISTLTRTGLLMLQGTGRVRRPALIVSAEAVVNVGLSVVLAQHLGLKGVALGTLIAAALALAFLLPLVCREFELEIGSFLAELARAHLPPALVAAGIALLVRQLGTGGIPETLFATLGIAGSYAGLLIKTGMTPEERGALGVRLRAKWT